MTAPGVEHASWGPRDGPGSAEPAAAGDAAPAVRLRGVGKRFGAVEALAGIDLTVARGEVVAVVGPSGCGKSTLLELVCGLAEPTTGSVDAQPAVLMPQRDSLLPWLTALDNAALPLRIHGTGRDRAREEARPLMRDFGLGDFEQARPHELSGGMRQRVGFVRTLLAGKPVLCLDEPFGALDAISRADMQAWLAGALVAQPRTVVLVTHDVEEALILADRVVVLSPRPGRVVATLPVDAPRPRSRTDAAIVALREQALGVLGR